MTTTVDSRPPGPHDARRMGAALTVLVAAPAARPARTTEGHGGAGGNPTSTQPADPPTFPGVRSLQAGWAPTTSDRPKSAGGHAALGRHPRVAAKPPAGERGEEVVAGPGSPRAGHTATPESPGAHVLPLVEAAYAPGAHAPASRTGTAPGSAPTRSWGRPHALRTDGAAA